MGVARCRVGTRIWQRRGSSEASCDGRGAPASLRGGSCCRVGPVALVGGGPVAAWGPLCSRSMPREADSPMESLGVERANIFVAPTAQGDAASDAGKGAGGVFSALGVVPEQGLPRLPGGGRGRLALTWGPRARRAAGVYRLRRPGRLIVVVVGVVLCVLAAVGSRSRDDVTAARNAVTRGVGRSTGRVSPSRGTRARALRPKANRRRAGGRFSVRRVHPRARRRPPARVIRRSSTVGGPSTASDRSAGSRPIGRASAARPPVAPGLRSSSASAITQPPPRWATPAPPRTMPSRQVASGQSVAASSRVEPARVPPYAPPEFM
jgi:hypothetical protein